VAGSGLTSGDIRACIWNYSTRAFIAGSTNVVSSGASTAGIQNNLSLFDSSGTAYTHTMNAGDVVWLGVIAYFTAATTTPTVNGLNISTSGADLLGPVGLSGRIQQQGGSLGWTGGNNVSAIGAVPGSGSFIPWVELIA
jgi:hypothetical protein